MLSKEVFVVKLPSNDICFLAKEVDSLKRNQKQSAASQGAVEVRLNRAQEEADRYKAELQKARTSSRVTADNPTFLFF